MRKKRPTLIAEALDRILKELGIEHKVKEEMALSCWSEIVGPYIARVSFAERVENGVLYVKVENPAWKHHLFMLRREIIKKINEHLKFDAIKEIVFIDIGQNFKNKV
jgi:predicted nucleic acid-binding Zn ribbon protein